jgi:hypothetical protein
VEEFSASESNLRAIANTTVKVKSSSNCLAFTLQASSLSGCGQRIKRCENLALVFCLTATRILKLVPYNSLPRLASCGLNYVPVLSRKLSGELAEIHLSLVSVLLQLSFDITYYTTTSQLVQLQVNHDYMFLRLPGFATFVNRIV